MYDCQCLRLRVSYGDIIINALSDHFFWDVSLFRGCRTLQLLVESWYVP